MLRSSRKRQSVITPLHLDMPKAVSAVAPKESIAPEPRASWRQCFGIGTVILACLAGVLAISFFVLMNQSIRLDESQSLWQTSHSLSGMLRVVATDVHVPGYHILLHFWQLYLGNDVLVIRGLSLLFFLATIPVVYLLARQILSVRWALFATALFSFSPFMNWYANETRMYTMLAFMTALNQLFYMRILKRRKGWIGFTVTALIGAYTHYFFMFTLAAQGIFYLLNRDKFAKGTFKKLAVVAGLIVLELLPWIWYFTSLGSASNTRPMLAAPSTVDFFNAFSQFLYGFQTDTVNTILISCWPLLMLIAFFAVNRQQRVTPEVGYIATMAFMPVVAAFVLSFLVTPFFVSRYLIAAVGPLIILSVWLISYYKRKAAIGVALLMVLVVGVTSFQQNTSAQTPVKEDYKRAAQTIAADARAQDVVVISSPFTIYPFEYYYNGVAKLSTLPIWDRVSAGSIPPFEEGKLPEQVKELKEGHRYIYLVLSYDQGYQEEIRQYMDKNYERTRHTEFSDDLDLYVYRVGYDTVPGLGSPATTKPVNP